MNGREEVMVFIIYDRAIDEEVMEMLSELGVNYYTKFKDITGVGRKDPHLGDHVWPGLNNVTMVAVEKTNKDRIIEEIRELQLRFPSVGLRAFVLPITESI